jgi:hypothetical protein
MNFAMFISFSTYARVSKNTGMRSDEGIEMALVLSRKLKIGHNC